MSSSVLLFLHVFVILAGWLELVVSWLLAVHGVLLVVRLLRDQLLGCWGGVGTSYLCCCFLSIQA